MNLAVIRGFRYKTVYKASPGRHHVVRGSRKISATIGVSDPGSIRRLVRNPLDRFALSFLTAAERPIGNPAPSAVVGIGIAGFPVRPCPRIAVPGLPGMTGTKEVNRISGDAGTRRGLQTPVKLRNERAEI